MMYCTEWILMTDWCSQLESVFIDSWVHTYIQLQARLYTTKNKDQSTIDDVMTSDITRASIQLLF